MSDVKDLWEKRVIGPIQPITTFDISQLQEAMTYFSSGVHTGKVVITFEDPKSRLQVSSLNILIMTCSLTRQISHMPKGTKFDPDGAYILVGCLGSLGLSIAVWMVERGARHIVFLSRLGSVKEGTSAMMDELRSMGAAPQVIRCDVTDRSSALDTVNGVTSERKLKGVIHAAMVEGVCSSTTPDSSEDWLTNGYSGLYV